MAIGSAVSPLDGSMLADGPARPIKYDDHTIHGAEPNQPPVIAKSKIGMLADLRAAVLMHAAVTSRIARVSGRAQDSAALGTA